MRALRLLCLITVPAATAWGQTVFNGVVSNPGCPPGSANNCAVFFAPTGPALRARDSFTSSVRTPLALNDLESVPPFRRSVALDFGAFGSANLASDGGGDGTDIGETIVGQFATSGRIVYRKFAGGAQPMTMRFSQAMSAVGFYLMDYGEFGGGLTLRFLLNSSIVSEVLVKATDSALQEFNPEFEGSIRFFGAVFDANAFDSIEFVMEDGFQADVGAFDDFLVTAFPGDGMPAVPEPTALAMFAPGALGLAGFARRRRSGRRAPGAAARI
jgi:hypothetical protein